MNLREVTIGRSKDCDIYLDPRCEYASNHHAVIYYDGSQMMFKDTSANGTLINNISVKHRSVPIHHGDIIMLAGKYLVNWNQIDSYFPQMRQRTKYMGTVSDDSLNVQAATAPNVTKWNWGAFGIYPIWGFFNGCWWGILISLFLGLLYPIPNIIFGIYGTRWSWNNKTWDSVQKFESAQYAWAICGIVTACIAVPCWIFYIYLFIVLMQSGQW